jgi:predicted lipoprotein with Yx(FWY)xxD motif
MALLYRKRTICLRKRVVSQAPPARHPEIAHQLAKESNMIRRTSLTGIASLAAIPLVALALAGCGSSGTSGASGTSAPTTATGQSGAVDVRTTNLGSVLVDSQGMTLYLFQADSGTTSACSGACATAWPPLPANGQPTVGNGANSSLLGTTPRSDGTSQVTYNGHPVYTFVKDQSAGDTKGEGVNAFGGLWYVLSPAGDQITSPASPSPSPSSSSSPSPSTSSGY